MRFVRQSDNIAFVLQADRDHDIDCISMSDLKSVLLPTILESHSAEHYCLREHDERISGIFSRYSGFAFAESLQITIQKNDFIWSEKIPGEDKFAVVVCANGKIVCDGVYSDNESDTADLQEQFIVVAMGASIPPLYLFGDAHPYIQEFSADIESENIKIADESYFDTIIANDEFYLGKKESGRVNNAIVFIAVGAILLAAVMYFSFSEGPKNKETKVIRIDPYEGYREAMKDAAGSSSLYNIYEKINISTGLSSWTLATCSYATRKMLCSHIPLPTSVTDEIMDLARYMKAVIEFDGETIRLTHRIDAQRLSSNDIITPLQAMVLKVRDDIQQIVMPGSISLKKEMKVNEYWGKQQIELELNGILLEELQLLSEAIRGLPVTLNLFSITRQENTFNARLSIDVFGSL